MSYDEFLPYYQGKIQSVIVVSTQGQRIQFPAAHIRKYVMPYGISGYFCMNTENTKFLSLEKIR
jgi:hypothetical protein